MPDNGPTALYRFFAADKSLLYVGITNNIKKRWRYHETEQATTWWPLVSSNTVRWFTTRTEAEQQEVLAIRSEFPQYNVMHTPKNRLPYGNRRGTVTAVSDTRGDRVLQAIRGLFPETPFTQLDVLPHVPLCRSSVQKNFHALMLRNEIVQVGRRSDGRRGAGHALYALPGSRFTQSDQQIRQVSEVGQRRLAGFTQGQGTSWWKYGSAPGEAAFRTLEAARKAYAEASFTREALAAEVGLSMPGLLKHVISLEKHGFIRCVGRDDPIPGRSGHPPKLYAVTDLEPPK